MVPKSVETDIFSNHAKYDHLVALTLILHPLNLIWFILNDRSAATVPWIDRCVRFMFRQRAHPGRCNGGASSAWGFEDASRFRVMFYNILF